MHGTGPQLRAQHRAAARPLLRSGTTKQIPGVERCLGARRSSPAVASDAEAFPVVSSLPVAEFNNKPEASAAATIDQV